MRVRWLPIVIACVTLIGASLMVDGVAPATTQGPTPPTLTDFWEGAAVWDLQIMDTHLPIGESDTLHMGGDEYWSYLHASTASARITDSCGDPVEFPGCITRWVSTDGGRHFSLSENQCLLPCDTCPCTAEDRTWQQQYPRVERAPNGVLHMVFEHGAATFYTLSFDGLTWISPRAVRDTGVWNNALAPCPAYMRINAHPFTSVPYDCMQGGPPGLYIEGRRMYLFVGQGQSPGHIGCLWSTLSTPEFFPCFNNPLLGGAREYGPFDALGAQANPYWDFRYTTSADVLKDGDMYYMVYEGIRGPESNEVGGDTQFALGMARSPELDSPAWEPYPLNPILGDVGGNVGIGHADLIVIDGVTMMYTATPEGTRGRYALVWR